MPYDPFAEFQKYSAMAAQTRAATPDPGRAINAGIAAGAQLRKSYDTHAAEADAAKNAATVAQAKQAYAPGVGDVNAQAQADYDAQNAPKPAPPAPQAQGPAPGQPPAFMTPQLAALDAAYAKQGADVAPRSQLGGAQPARELGPAPAPYPTAPRVAPQAPVVRPAQLPVPMQQPPTAGPPAPLQNAPPPAPAPMANQDALPPDWKYIPHQF